MVNQIVFGIPSPPRRFQYFNEHLFPDESSEIEQTPLLVELNLEPHSHVKVYLQNENPFDVQNSRFENIWVLLKTLSPENVIMIFKRLLFNTCNILVCKDGQVLNKCIQGILELFYPLSCDLVCIPNLPMSMLQYVNMCGQCVLGVVQEKKEESGKAKSVFDEKDIQDSKVCNDLFDIM